MRVRWPRLSRHQLLITIGFLLHMYNNLAYRFIDSFVPIHADDEGASQFEIGIIFSAFCLAIFLLSPLFGSLCVAHGYKAVILLGLCIEGTALCFLSFTSRLNSSAFIATMIILRAVEGVGSAATQTGCYSMLAAESGDDGDGAGSGMGGMEMFGGVGNMLGPIIGAWLADSYDYSVPFVAIGVLGLLAAVGTTLTLPKRQQLIDEVDLDFIAKNTLPIAPSTSRPSSPKAVDSTGEPAAAAEPTFVYTVPESATHSSPSQQQSSSRDEIPTSIRALVGDTAQSDTSIAPTAVTLRQVLAVPSVSYSALVAVVALACMSMLSATLEIFFHEQFGLSDVEIGLCLALASFVQLVSCPLAGYISDHYATKLPMFIGLTLLSVALLLLGPSPILPFAPNLPMQVTSLCILGCGVSLAIIPTFVDQIKSAAHLGTASQPVIAGLSASSFSLGEVIGPFLGSSLVAAWSFPGATTLLAFACMGVLALGGVGVWLSVVPFDAEKGRGERMRREQEEKANQGVQPRANGVNGHSNGHLPDATSPSSGGKHKMQRKKPSAHKPVKHMVELIKLTVNAERRRRAGYREAQRSPPSPSPPSPGSSVDSAGGGPRYSPNPSYILDLEGGAQYGESSTGGDGEEEEEKRGAEPQYREVAARDDSRYGDSVVELAEPSAGYERSRGASSEGAEDDLEEIDVHDGDDDLFDLNDDAAEHADELAGSARAK